MSVAPTNALVVTRRMAPICVVLCVLLCGTTTTVHAFAGIRIVVSSAKGPAQGQSRQQPLARDVWMLYSSNDKDGATAAAASPSAFVSLEGGKDEDDDDDLLEKVELLGKGAAKVCICVGVWKIESSLQRLW
jgi:hypothetical protein